MKYVISEQIRTLPGLNTTEWEKESTIAFEELQSAYSKLESPEKSLLFYISTTTAEFTKQEAQQTKTAEYTRLMERLRAEQQERQYQSYLAKEDDDRSVIDSIGQYRHQEKVLGNGSIAKEVNYQLTTIVNILITTCSSGYAVWYWSGSSAGGLNYGLRMLLSLLAAAVVLLAEVVIFGGYLRRVDEARDRESKKVETREIVESVVFTGKARAKASGIQRHG